MSDSVPHLTEPAPAQAGVPWTDPRREAAFDAWLAALAPRHGLQPASLRPASADASFRRYLRVDGQAGSFIIMDAPPEREDCAPFVKVAGLMAEAGLHVPRVLAWDAPQGFMLLDDLGTQTMIEVVDAQQPAASQAL
ncbi:MAG TPA: phosphotransferase, partial [Ramlibacter sp.]|nr:phosphotransferase [Ramlibacter sp.]